MKKHILFKFYVILTILIHKKNIQTSDIGNFRNNVDPVVDLRTPRSLMEDMHNGLNDVYMVLETGLEEPADNVSHIAQSAQGDLDKLSDMYDSMLDTTRGNQVYNEDKEFLQKMIDRINSMIEALEGNSSVVDNDQEDTQEALRSVKASCNSFKAKISF